MDIGLPSLNEQHKKLIALSNSLIQAMINGQGKTVLEDLFSELLDYTNYHFSEEEKYMEGIGYPQLEKHKIEHLRLTKKVKEFKKRLLESSEKMQISPDEALDFINNWIAVHIMEMDSQIGIFVKSKK